MSAGDDGTLAIELQEFETKHLRLSLGPWVLQVERVALTGLAMRLRGEGGSPQLVSLQAAGAELSGLALQGPVAVPAQANEGAAAAPAPAWSLAPLASADGAIRANIVDAHLGFDAEVTVPLRQGVVDFDDATVEHVGPDSRMGVSHLGIYVDAPNGRSYLHQFASPPVAGVEYERRGALLGTMVSDRGKLRLQEFGEALLRQGKAGHGLGFTEQARMLFDRTSVSGEVRLGDGRLALPGMQADLIGSAQGRNAARLHSEAVGRGLSAEIALLALRDFALQADGRQLQCDEITGTVTLRLSVEGAQLRFGLQAANLKLSGLRLRPGGQG